MRNISLAPIVMGLSIAALLLVAIIALPAFAPNAYGADVALYETFERSVTNTKNYSNKFDYSAIALRGSFTAPSGKSFIIDGFYDGNASGGQGTIWKLRFMPMEAGTWQYSYMWSDDTPGGSGSFTVGPRVNTLNHGHVHVDPQNSRMLVHDDGSPHYFFGSKWFGNGHVGPAHPQNNPYRLSDSVLTSFLEELKTYRHNGILMKMGLMPVADDKISWWLEWINRTEWFIREAGKRGIYVQQNFFDCWSHKRGTLFDVSTSGSEHTFNVWASGDEHAKRNYIRTMVARLGGYYNVYWELGNEMENHNSGSAFALQANSKYLPWIRSADPYDLPIGVSEHSVYESTNVDIGFLHQTNTLGEILSDKSTIMNELVRGGVSTNDLYADASIRNSSERIAYRRTFWRMFTMGGTGSIEASWLQVEKPLTTPVYNVMGDQKRLRELLESLPVSINQMTPDFGFVKSGPGSYTTRSRSGEAYVSYFLLSPKASTGAGSISVNLPTGTYDATWYDPKAGTYSTAQTVNGGSSVSISYPSFTEDAVLKVTKKGLAGGLGLGSGGTTGGGSSGGGTTPPPKPASATSTPPVPRR